jgi:hypothetical protein
MGRPKMIPKVIRTERQQKINDIIYAVIAWNFPDTLGKGNRQLHPDAAIKEIEKLFDGSEK